MRAPWVFLSLGLAACATSEEQSAELTTSQTEQAAIDPTLYRWKLDETSGSTYADSGPSARNLPISGTIVGTTDRAPLDGNGGAMALSTTANFGYAISSSVGAAHIAWSLGVGGDATSTAVAHRIGHGGAYGTGTGTFNVDTGLTLQGDPSAQEGKIARSVDGNHITFGAYGVPVGTATPQNGTKFFGRVSNFAFTLSTSAMSNSVLLGATPIRSLVSTDGTALWPAGGDNTPSAGFWFTPTAASPAPAQLTNLFPIAQNMIARDNTNANQLYGLFGTNLIRVGSGLPTTGGQVSSVEVDLGVIASAGAFADLDPTVAGDETFFYAQNRNVFRRTRNGAGTWGAQTVIGALPQTTGAITSLLVHESSTLAVPVLFIGWNAAPWTANGTTGAFIYRWTQATGFVARYNGGPNYSIRGLAQMPTETADPIELPGNASIALWVKMTSTPGSDSSIIGFLDNCGFSQYDVRLTSTRRAIFYTNQGTITIPSQLTLNRWHHIAFVTSGNVTTGYIDGTLAVTGTAGIKSIRGYGQVFRLGRSGCGGGFNGALDEVRMYDRALTSGEVADLGQRPGAPVVSATILSPTSVQLDWPAVTNIPVSKYFVYRGTAPGNETFFTTVTTNSAVLTQLTPGTTYYWYVRARSATGKVISDNSNEVVTAQDSGVPTNLAATPVSASQIDLIWDGVSGASKYYVYEQVGGAGAFNYVGTTATNTYSRTRLASGTSYAYRVRAQLGSAVSADSNTATASTNAIPVPQNVTATNDLPKHAYVQWDAVASATKYYVYQSVNGGGYAYIGTQLNTFFNIGNLANGSHYDFVIRAVTPEGTSGDSAPAGVDIP